LIPCARLSTARQRAERESERAAVDAAALVLPVERNRRTEPPWLLGVCERENRSMTFVDRGF
jgi:hypothetical protein